MSVKEGEKVSGKKVTFAVFFGNRGFFPASLQSGARTEMREIIERAGYGCLMMDAAKTRYGAVETPEEGRKYAAFLEANRGSFDGIILCLPNFGDENGAVDALQAAKVPILVQAYPDELDKMAPALRRDAFCGKFSIMDVFKQNDIAFTVLKPHVVAPSSPAFAANLDYFGRLCRVVTGLKKLRVGAIGARTTAFKTVRIDELALQKRGVTVETYDLSSIMERMKGIRTSSKAYKEKATKLRAYSDWSGAPESAFDTIVRLGATLDEVLARDNLDCIALRCWVEMQEILKISPCVLMGMLNDDGTSAACELDIGNAVAMRALSLASDSPAACLDWNNNYGDDEDKCILFHCGPVPRSLMAAKGKISDHLILANAVGAGCSFGCDVGRIRQTPFTYGSLMTEDGVSRIYLGQGEFTADKIPANYFGCAGVARIAGLQDRLLTIGEAGFRHHVSVTAGTVAGPVEEALSKYLGYETIKL
jgi:L-fucose isomerase-like protein